MLLLHPSRAGIDCPGTEEPIQTISKDPGIGHGVIPHAIRSGIRAVGYHRPIRHVGREVCCFQKEILRVRRTQEGKCERIRRILHDAENVVGATAWRLGLSNR